MNTKLTILYERLSREDERETESISIENQKAFLEDYATQNGFTNLLHLTDDGWSGTRWDRPSYLRLIEEVERGNVANCIVKDMSRIGRDHLRVGLLLEQFRESGVRFIAVNDNVDTDKGMDDFTPFRNIINEWVARDCEKDNLSSVFCNTYVEKRAKAKAKEIEEYIKDFTTRDIINYKISHSPSKYVASCYHNYYMKLTNLFNKVITEKESVIEMLQPIYSDSLPE
jgi:hypothetical protein